MTTKMKIFLTVWIAAWLLVGVLSAAAKPVQSEYVGYAKTITVYDHTADPWRALVAQTVQEFNAVMPRALGKLRYMPMEPALCSDPPDHKHGITVCSGDIPPAYGGLAQSRHETLHTFQRSLIQLTSEPAPDWWFDVAVCHEFMHALTGVPDSYNSDPQSCVWGNLSAPGPTDLAILAKTAKQVKAEAQKLARQQQRAKRHGN